jgi:Flp pilus assembly protein TadD
MKTLPLQILAAAAAVLPAHAVDTPGSDPMVRRTSVDDRMASARTAIGARDYARAITELTAAVREQPNNADAHNLLGYSWRKRPQPDITKAFEHYYTALRIDPRHKGAHEYIGQAYLMEKRPVEAEKHLAELEKICGKACGEYQELARAIAEFKAGR